MRAAGHTETADMDRLLRRLGLEEDDLLDAPSAGRAWWQERARRDPAATTELAYLLAKTGRLLGLVGGRPHRYFVERRILQLVEEPERRAELLAALERLWDEVPYVGSPAARSSVLRRWGADASLVELADLLVEVRDGALPAGILPVALSRPGDGEAVEATTIAERARRLSEEALADLELSWLPPEVARLAEGDQARVLRRIFALSSASVAMLVCYARAHPRRHARGPSLHAGMSQLERLVAAAGLTDDDPLLGLELDPGEIRIGIEAVVDFELGVESDYHRALDGLGRTPTAKEAERAAAQSAKGIQVLLDVLVAARRAGARIEALPSVRLVVGTGRSRTYGHVDDSYFPEPDELAEMFALGIEELAGEGDRELLRALLFALSTACRPKESCPRKEDLAPLGDGHLMAFLDHETGKTGSRELYVPACAIAYFGVSADWFPSRSWAEPHPLEVLGLAPRRKRRPRWHAVLPDEETDRARRRLEAACRRLRDRYRSETGRELSDRLAYVVRKMVAAYLWRVPIRPPDALTDVLGHEDLSGDAPYTRPSRSEVLAQNVSLIDAARAWGDTP